MQVLLHIINRLCGWIKPLILSCFMLLIVCFGCRLGPNYHSPEPDVPDEWKATTAPIESTTYFENWWEIFHDETLNCLEEQAILNNPNLYVALERIVEARAIAGVNRADLFPQIGLNPAYNNSGQLYQFFIPSGLNIPTIDQGVSPFFRIHQFLYAIPLSLSYEVDLWGKVRGKYESALYQAEAQVQDYYTSLLTLTAELTTHYFQLRTFDAQVDSLQATAKSYQRSFDLVNSRFQKGVVNYTDVSRASLQLTNAKANIEDTVRQRQLEENVIAVLVGAIPSEFSLEHNPIQGTPPMIPAGVPASILAKRPDIAEAERILASEQRLIGVAYASFLPSISLTGALGYTSPDFGQFLKWISRYWSLGANAQEPLIDGGRNISNVQVACARYRQASGIYQQTVLTAFKEVENALNNIQGQAKQSVFLESSMTASEKTYQLSNQRYGRGLVSYLEVVDSERDKLNVQLTLIALQGARYLSTVQLIKALGGSWEMCSPDETLN